MDRKRSHPPLGILLILLGVGFLLSACSQQIPTIIPVTALRQIYPSEPWLRIIMGIVGVILLVAGFSLTKILIQMIGFFGGGAAGLFLVQYFWPDLGGGAIIGFVVGAIIGVAVVLTATDIGAFVAGALVGVSLAQQAWPYLEGHAAPLLGIILCGIIGGILTVWLLSYWVAALTSILGAILLGMALNLQPVYWILIALAGILIQTVISRKGPTAIT